MFFFFCYFLHVQTLNLLKVHFPRKLQLWDFLLLDLFRNMNLKLKINSFCLQPAFNWIKSCWLSFLTIFSCPAVSTSWTKLFTEFIQFNVNKIIFHFFQPTQFHIKKRTNDSFGFLCPGLHPFIKESLLWLKLG